MSVVLYYIPLLFQFTKGDKALQACIRILPFIIPFVVFVMISGGLLMVSGRAPPWFIAGGALVITGGALLHEIDSNTKTAAIYGYEILISIGLGLVFQNGYAVATAAVKPEHISATLAPLNVFQIGAGVTSLSITGTIFQNRGFVLLEHALDGYGYGEVELRSLMAGFESQILQDGTEEVKAKATSAIVKAIATVQVMSVTGGALLLLCGAGMNWRKMNAPAVVAMG